MLPLCSAASIHKGGPDGAAPEVVPVTSAVYLVDIASFTFKQAWNVRAYAQDISKLLATCYPEVVARVYVSCRMHFCARAPVPFYDFLLCFLSLFFC